MKRIICWVVGHQPRPTVPYEIQVPGGEGARPFVCLRCRSRMRFICDEWEVVR